MTSESQTPLGLAVVTNTLFVINSSDRIVSIWLPYIYSIPEIKATIKFNPGSNEEASF